jgi:hypothetical protein
MALDSATTTLPPSLRYGQAHLTTALDCHPLKPLADRYDHTLSSTLEDVVTVCSNCHRLLHSDRKTLSLDEARLRLKKSPSSVKK